MIKQLDENLIDINEIKEDSVVIQNIMKINSVIDKQKLYDFFNSEFHVVGTEQECLDRFKMCIILSAVLCNKTNCYGAILSKLISDLLKTYLKCPLFELIDVEYSPLNSWFTLEYIQDVCYDYDDNITVDKKKYSYKPFMFEKQEYDGYSIVELGNYVINFKMNNRESHCVVCYRKASSTSLAPIIRNISEEQYEIFKRKTIALMEKNPYLSGGDYNSYNDSLFNLD